MTVCSVPVLHNTTASRAIHKSNEHRHVHRYVLINDNEPALRLVSKPCWVDRKSFRGPITADAIVATVGDARQYKNGRQFAASLGITPRQHGSGGKTHLGAITRRGDSYLRCLLVQGARCILQAALRLHKNKPDALNRLQLWMVKLNDRVGYHKAAVAIANKHARQVWAMITRGEAYNAEAYKDWEAAHATVRPGDIQQASDDDLSTAALAAASV
jgi:hypothetical protein